MEKYNTEKVFSRYTVNNTLREADIFHLYDTGEECMEDNSGYHDSRHFILKAFNSKTMETRDLGRHDGIACYLSDLPVDIIRVYADGSFFVRFKRLAEIELFQQVNLI